MVLRLLLHYLRRAFVDAGKTYYDQLDLARERRRPLVIPGVTAEYAPLDVRRMLGEALVEMRQQVRLEDIFGELGWAQFIIAFEGPHGDRNARATIRSYFETTDEYADYLNSLSFIYHTHDNPFRRLESIIISLLMNNEIPCYSAYNPASTSL